MADTTPADEEREPTPSAASNEDEDRLEGGYTEVDGEAPHVRGVPGAYTRTDGATDDESSVGDYVSSAAHPTSHDPSERRGKFARADHGERSGETRDTHGRHAADEH
ncbi:hypothetical protein [Agromyces aerolatus]|uniref:hypothetical protein n=1 Tax=Agromyces sp. LY-1074 TaxID=3074080 RepID=UPI00285CF134|nr:MULTISPECIES: hypothetical protein [unclassified Agromyces]MDR5700279.1 hypothetical protein [Agromyces sp. LY-1074]MDR5706743.1 hypothetical protein [Agromyces sp. LY-1358]